MIIRGYQIILLCVSTAMFVGCGPSDGMVPVSGTVQLDGKPVEKGNITFTPVDGQGSTAGAPIEAGKYSARISPGKMKVSINSPKVIGTKKLYNTPDSPVREEFAEAIPAKYNASTELVRDVTSGATLDFDLKSNE